MMLGDNGNRIQVHRAELIERSTALADLELRALGSELVRIQIAQDDLSHRRMMLEQGNETVRECTNATDSDANSHRVMFPYFA